MKTTKNKLIPFIVMKGGRAVDCVKAADISIALQIALDAWERFIGRDETFSVDLMPPAKPRPVIVKPTKSEIKAFGSVPVKQGWPFTSIIHCDVTVGK